MTHNTPQISPLRQRMSEDMALRKLAPQTQAAYIHAVKNFTCFLKRAPDTASAEDLRQYQLHLVEQGISSGNLNATLTGLTFFFGTTLECHEAMAKTSHVHHQTLPYHLSACTGANAHRPSSRGRVHHGRCRVWFARVKKRRAGRARCEPGY